MNRVVATAPAAQAAAKEVQATPSTDKKPRRVTPPAIGAGAVAAGLAGAAEPGAGSFGTAGAGEPAPSGAGCPGSVVFESSVKPPPRSWKKIKTRARHPTARLAGRT